MSHREANSNSDYIASPRYTFESKLSIHNIHNIHCADYK